MSTVSQSYFATDPGCLAPKVPRLAPFSEGMIFATLISPPLSLKHFFDLSSTPKILPIWMFGCQSLTLSLSCFHYLTVTGQIQLLYFLTSVWSEQHFKRWLKYAYLTFILLKIWKRKKKQEIWYKILQKAVSGHCIYNAVKLGKTPALHGPVFC